MARSVSPPTAARKRQEEEAKRQHSANERSRQIHLSVIAVRGGPISQHGMKTRHRAASSSLPTTDSILEASLETLKIRFPFLEILQTYDYNKFFEDHKEYCRDLSLAVYNSRKMVSVAHKIKKGCDFSQHQTQLVTVAEALKKQIVQLNFVAKYPYACFSDLNKLPSLVSALRKYSTTMDDTNDSQSSTDDETCTSISTVELAASFKKAQIGYKKTIEHLLKKFPELAPYQKDHPEEFLKFDHVLLSFITNFHVNELNFWKTAENGFKAMLKTIVNPTDWLDEQNRLSAQSFDVYRKDFTREHKFIDAIDPSKFPIVIYLIREVKRVSEELHAAKSAAEFTPVYDTVDQSQDELCSNKRLSNIQMEVPVGVIYQSLNTGDVAVIANKPILAETARKSIETMGMTVACLWIVDSYVEIDNNSLDGKTTLRSIFDFIKVREQQCKYVFVSFNWPNMDSLNTAQAISEAVNSGGFTIPVVARLRALHLSKAIKETRNCSHRVAIYGTVKEAAAAIQTMEADSAGQPSTSPVLF